MTLIPRRRSLILLRKAFLLRPLCAAGFLSAWEEGLRPLTPPYAGCLAQGSARAADGPPGCPCLLPPAPALALLGRACSPRGCSPSSTRILLWVGALTLTPRGDPRRRANVTWWPLC